MEISNVSEKDLASVDFPEDTGSGILRH